MDDCPVNFFGVRRCNFEPRYDRIPPNEMPPLDTTVHGARTVIAAMTKSIYVHDVCTGCGKTVCRPTAT